MMYNRIWPAAALATMVMTWGLERPARGNPQAIEIGPANVRDLPRGREADGIIGDFVLRNDQVEIVISGNLHERRANMFVLGSAPTPGCIYDFTLRDTDNDQLTLFAPGAQKGQLSQVMVLKDGSDGEAVIRAELTAAAGNGMGRRHDYILCDHWRHLVVISTYENRSAKPVRIKPAPLWLGLVSEQNLEGVHAALCQDPDDRVGYAYAGVKWPGAQPATGGEVELPATQSASFAAALAIGAGAADAFGVIRSLDSESHVFVGRVIDTSGRAVPGASLHVTVSEDKKPLVGYVDPDGKYRLTLPRTDCKVILRDIGRDDLTVELTSGREQTFAMSAPSGVEIEVVDDHGAPLPCKVQFTGIEGTPDPVLGPVIRAHGCDNQYHSENGRIRQALPPGKYHLTITRGIEYDHHEQDVAVEKGRMTPVRATLRRVVDTTGWVSCDFHNHTTESGDNYCGTADRVINLAAEHIEFAPTTEHNRISDWQPHIDRLGLARYVRTVKGIELTGGGPHLNAFPLPAVPDRQDNGGPQWDPDPRISALRLRNMPGDHKTRWVQLNHPNVSRYFNDLDGDKRPDGGFAGLLPLIDGAEVYGNFILSRRRHYQREWRGKTYQRDNWPFLWMQMLNAGHRLVTVATSDAHEITQGGVGGWRSYVPAGTDEPAAVDPGEIVENAKRGRLFVTTGPFLTVSTSTGEGPGDTIRRTGRVELKVRVQCNTWTDADRVVVLVNGRPVPTADFNRKAHPNMFSSGVVRFEQTIPVELASDAHLIVVASGEESTLETGYGKSWQSRMQPIAYHNPIFVDVDGGGFEPNHDTLGLPYLDYGFPPGSTRPAE